MTASNELVVFAVGQRNLGIPASTVREIINAVAVTEIPGAPRGVDGVIDVRGALLPVVDLSERLGLAARSMRPSEHLMICDITVGVVAVRADRVLELRVMDAESMPSGTEADPIVRGLMRTRDGVIVICELSEFLSETDFAAVASAIRQLGPAS